MGRNLKHVFADRMRLGRDRTRYTQIQAAHELFISVSTLRRYEAGFLPAIDMLERIAKLYGVEPSWFFDSNNIERKENRNMNKVQLVGRLASDVDLKTTGNGNQVCSFRIAVNRRYKDGNGKYPADFIGCVAWRNTAEFISKYFAKGNLIGVTGSIQCREYTAQDGSKRYVTEVMVDEAEFVGGKNEGTAKTNNAEGFLAYEEADDLPF